VKIIVGAQNICSSMQGRIQKIFFGGAEGRRGLEKENFSTGVRSAEKLICAGKK